MQNRGFPLPVLIVGSLWLGNKILKEKLECVKVPFLVDICHHCQSVSPVKRFNFSTRTDRSTSSDLPTGKFRSKLLSRIILKDLRISETPGTLSLTRVENFANDIDNTLKHIRNDFYS